MPLDFQFKLWNFLSGLLAIMPPPPLQINSPTFLSLSSSLPALNLSHTGIMERTVSFELGSMGCAMGFGRIARQPPSTRTHPERCVDCQRNENHSRDSVPFSSDFARRQWSGLHEGGYSIFTWNGRAVRCAARWNAARPSPMYFIGSCATALSTAANAVRSLVAFVAIVALHSAVHHWIAVLQRDDRQYTDCAASRRHVPNGKIPRNRQIKRENSYLVCVCVIKCQYFWR